MNGGRREVVVSFVACPRAPARARNAVMPRCSALRSPHRVFGASWARSHRAFRLHPSLPGTRALIARNFQGLPFRGSFSLSAGVSRLEDEIGQAVALRCGAARVGPRSGLAAVSVTAMQRSADRQPAFPPASRLWQRFRRSLAGVASERCFEMLEHALAPSNGRRDRRLPVSRALVGEMSRPAHRKVHPRLVLQPRLCALPLPALGRAPEIWDGALHAGRGESSRVFNQIRFSAAGSLAS
ncbi:hypothetical protein PHYSODRAFT_341826 [Phytophthora sojae]|uniref:Uncharacterized protein n=1 Tax=Phytophthora sojae (strain P6497) TaxID=1094619 RepID=G5AEH7_PHYSP|nr:hypothetical protein PHYSODRAFT_341826 [Phytophthora sojae]EGZ06579.1 hypothetical protein PHYSODRAFT_341826 [Phytophthora sojae]|eukprot:XP_009538476.1 hypothetical protein PHYSODRAFT_341826 [Phytophthora sojae]